MLGMALVLYDVTTGFVPDAGVAVILFTRYGAAAVTPPAVTISVDESVTGSGVLTPSV